MDEQRVNRERSELAVRQFCTLVVSIAMLGLIIQGFVNRNYWDVAVGLGFIAFVIRHGHRNLFKT
jgi:hypothetical protein